VPRDDPAFAEQLYWRGRVWAPLNFLTYLGLKRAGMDDAAGQLAAKSRRLFEFNYHATGGIYENYSPLDGVGGGVLYSDPLCPWSGLLVFMDLIEQKRVPLPSILRPETRPR
jgi:putative isomerase